MYRLTITERQERITEETRCRQKARLVQVRRQASNFSRRTLQRVQAESGRQVAIMKQQMAAEYAADKENRLAHMEAEYSACLRQVGSAHLAAARQPDMTAPRDALLDEQRRVAQHRHDQAMQRLRCSQRDLADERLRCETLRDLNRALERIRADRVAQAGHRKQLEECRRLQAEARREAAAQAADVLSSTHVVYQSAFRPRVSFRDDAAQTRPKMRCRSSRALQTTDTASLARDPTSSRGSQTRALSRHKKTGTRFLESNVAATAQGTSATTTAQRTSATTMTQGTSATATAQGTSASSGPGSRGRLSGEMEPGVGATSTSLRQPGTTASRGGPTSGSIRSGIAGRADPSTAASVSTPSHATLSDVPHSDTALTHAELQGEFSTSSRTSTTPTGVPLTTEMRPAPDRYAVYREDSSYDARAAAQAVTDEQNAIASGAQEQLLSRERIAEARGRQAMRRMSARSEYTRLLSELERLEAEERRDKRAIGVGSASQLARATASLASAPSAGTLATYEERQRRLNELFEDALLLAADADADASGSSVELVVPARDLAYEFDARGHRYADILAAAAGGVAQGVQAVNERRSQMARSSLSGPPGTWEPAPASDAEQPEQSLYSSATAMDQTSRWEDSAGEEDPGTYAAQDSDMYGQDPSTYDQDPIMYNQGPGMYAQTASMYDQDPNMYGQDPSMYGQDPDVYSDQDPNMYEQDPDIYEQDPNTYEQDPNVYEQDPNMYEQDTNMNGEVDPAMYASAGQLGTYSEEGIYASQDQGDGGGQQYYDAQYPDDQGGQYPEGQGGQYPEGQAAQYPADQDAQYPDDETGEPPQESPVYTGEAEEDQPLTYVGPDGIVPVADPDIAAANATTEDTGGMFSLLTGDITSFRSSEVSTPRTSELSALAESPAAGQTFDSETTAYKEVPGEAGRPDLPITPHGDIRQYVSQVLDRSRQELSRLSQLSGTTASPSTVYGSVEGGSQQDEITTVSTVGSKSAFGSDAGDMDMSSMMAEQGQEAATSGIYSSDPSQSAAASAAAAASEAYMKRYSEVMEKLSEVQQRRDELIRSYTSVSEGLRGAESTSELPGRGSSTRPRPPPTLSRVSLAEGAAPHELSTIQEGDTTGRTALDGSGPAGAGFAPPPDTTSTGSLSRTAGVVGQDDTLSQMSAITGSQEFASAGSPQPGTATRSAAGLTGSEVSLRSSALERALQASREAIRSISAGGSPSGAEQTSPDVNNIISKLGMKSRSSTLAGVHAGNMSTSSSGSPGERRPSSDDLRRRVLSKSASAAASSSSSSSSPAGSSSSGGSIAEVPSLVMSEDGSGMLAPLDLSAAPAPPPQTSSPGDSSIDTEKFAAGAVGSTPMKKHPPDSD